MDKHTIITSLVALVAIVTNAQQRLTVKDSLTQEPVAYTSVWFGDKGGRYTDDSGTIEIPEGTDRVRLSHISYQSKSISVADISEHTVSLVPKIVNLGEVCVSAKAPKRTKTTTIGTVKEKTRTCHRGTNGFEIALFVPYDSTWMETPYIHSILASLDYSTHWLTFTTIKTPIYATLRFDLRQPDDQTGEPKDESVINGGIIIQPNQKVGKDGVKLLNPIPFPTTGVFVVVEWITTAAVPESQNLVPALNMTLSTEGNKTWNKKTFRGMDWMLEQDEPIYQDELARDTYKGRIPCAKLGMEITSIIKK